MAISEMIAVVGVGISVKTKGRDIKEENKIMLITD